MKTATDAQGLAIAGAISDLTSPRLGRNVHRLEPQTTLLRSEERKLLEWQAATTFRSSERRRSFNGSPAIDVSLLTE